MGQTPQDAGAGTGVQPRVVVTRATPGEVRIDGCSVEVLGEGAAPREVLFDRARGAAALLSMHTDRVDEQLLDAAGSSLKIVANHAVGVDNIDLEACRRRGVVVTSTPDAVTEGTANIAMLLLLACARRLTELDRFARSGAWASHGPLGMKELLGLELAGRLLLIVGAGRIGYATALRARAFGMRVCYVARSRHPEFESSPLVAERVALDDGLRAADAVSVHTPLTSETRHLLDRRRLALLKPEAIVVNTSRGATIDEDALAEAVEAGRLWGAGLDVFEHEPIVDPRLAASDRVVMTPHIGSGERHYRRMMTEMAAENIRAVLQGRDAPNRVV